MAKEFKPCSVKSCNKNAHWSGNGRAGLCSSHYWRMREHGDPLSGGTGHGEPQKFYHEVVLPFVGEGCLIWPYGKRCGSGQMIKDGRRGEVTRFICEDVYGPPPTEDHEAAHSCGNGHLGCVTKSHLRWATHKENEADKMNHGTDQFRERNPSAKLTGRKAEIILSLKGKESQRSIAARFGVSQSTISDIHSGKRWIVSL